MTMSDPAREHILMTVLGIGPMATTYVLGRQSQASLRVLKDTGNAHALADLVAVSGEQAGDARAALRTLSEAYASGLPIELGYLARRFLAEHSEWLEAILHRQRLPLAGELVDDFAGILATWQITQELPETGWKARVRLDRTELERQARIIDGFLARDDYPTAFGLMREWLVLWAMWCTGEEHRWLNYHAREPTKRLLRDLAELARRPDRASSDQAVIGQVWDDLRELRNAYAHHGLDKSVTLSTEDRLANRVRAVVRVWRETFRTVPKFSLRTPPPDGRVLVSPVGMRPGVLFSALRTAGPDRLSRCLVICSAETVAAVGQACEAAGYPGDVRLLRLEDPFAGIAELEPRVREAKPYLLDAGEVFVNVTGGTTLMAVLAERIAGATRRDRVYRFALVDRRPPAAQEADPYQHGDVCWLDEQPGSEQA
jgi:hypothetical protein